MECRLLCIDIKSGSGARVLRNQKGVTLVELLIVITIAGVLAAIASLGLDGWHRSRLVAATGGLLADLQTTRMSAMTESSDLASRGYGLRFLTDGSYKVFEFVDKGTTPYVDFNYEDTTEETGGYEKVLGSGLSIKLGASGDPTGTSNAILYDKRGMSRTNNWSSVSNRTYVVRHSSLDRARCVAISQVRIREGVWNAAASPQCQIR